MTPPGQTWRFLTEFAWFKGDPYQFYHFLSIFDFFSAWNRKMTHWEFDRECWREQRFVVCSLGLPGVKGNNAKKNFRHKESNPHSVTPSHPSYPLDHRTAAGCCGGVRLSARCRRALPPQWKIGRHANSIIFQLLGVSSSPSTSPQHRNLSLSLSPSTNPMKMGAIHGVLSRKWEFYSIPGYSNLKPWYLYSFFYWFFLNLIGTFLLT